MLKNGTVMASLIHTAINLYANFEVSSLNRSQDTERGSNNSSKSRSCDPHDPFDLTLHYLLILTSVHLDLCQI